MFRYAHDRVPSNDTMPWPTQMPPSDGGRLPAGQVLFRKRSAGMGQRTPLPSRRWVGSPTRAAAANTALAAAAHVSLASSAQSTDGEGGESIDGVPVDAARVSSADGLGETCTCEVEQAITSSSAATLDSAATRDPCVAPTAVGSEAQGIIWCAKGPSASKMVTTHH
jgi:hypothetical protein